MSVMVLFLEMLDRWMICTIDIVLWSYMGRQWLGRSLPRDLLRSNCHWNVGGKVKLGDGVVVLQGD